MQFIRFLHTAPKVKQIPLPKGTTTVQDVSKHLDIVPAPRPPVQQSVVDAAMPEQVDASQLDQASGVWYFVERSRAGNLPVYTDYNNAGGVWTEVRKIKGNAAALKNDLKVMLELSKKEIWIQGTSQRVIIKGNHSERVKEILAERF